MTSTIVIWTIVVGWLVLTIGNQFGQWSPRLVGRIDVLNVVPRWTFFAPRPGRSDFHLLFRDVSNGRVIQAWTEIYPVVARSRAAWFWNPHKRRRKAVMDLANALMRIAATAAGPNDRNMVVSLPYLAFLNATTGAKRAWSGDDLVLTEFVVITTAGPAHEEPSRILVCSEPHAIAADCYAA